MSSKYIFKAADTFSRKVVLDTQQLQQHIIEDSGHIEMADDPKSIEKTVTKPDFIFESSTNPVRDVYFAKGAHKDYTNEYVKVVVDFSDPYRGFVVSAWTQPDVKGSIGVKKYEKVTSI